MDEDYLLAMQLQEQFNQEGANHQGIEGDVFETSSNENVMLGQWLPKEDTNADAPKNNSWSVVDPRWETIDPLPDARALFIEFNGKYFWNKLAGVEVRWSPRMTRYFR